MVPWALSTRVALRSIPIRRMERGRRDAPTISVPPMAIVWNCAHHQGFSDEAPRIYVLKVERQTLVPSLALAEREEAADN